MYLLMTLALAAPPETAATPGSPKLAVMDLELKKGLDQATAEMLNELMLERLSRSKRFGGVIGGSDLREMLSLEEQKAAMGCDADSCLAELGGALGVPLMLSSSLGTFAGNYILNLKLISVEDAKVLAHSRVVKDESKLLDELGASLDQIVAEGMDSAAKPSGESATASVQASQGRKRRRLDRHRRRRLVRRRSGRRRAAQQRRGPTPAWYADRLCPRSHLVV